jgi:hypothetical protein
MLRTRGYAGYQLLMLNDFTGQSEALVGILDPFWETKQVVSAAEVRAWNAGSPSYRPTVELPRSWIETHFRSAGLARRGVTVLHASSEDLAHGNNTAEWITLRFPQPVNARFLRLVARSEVHGQSFATLAELGLITNARFPSGFH